MDQAFLTTLAAIGGFIGKSVWDLYWRRREGFEALVRQKRLEFVERQLSLFYWPVYLHLQKNNVVWDHLVDGRAMNEGLRHTVDGQLYRTFFLPNNEDIVKLIESNIHLAQPDKDLEQLLLQFIRHVAVFRALRDAGLKDVDPIAVGEPWPAGLFGAVERRLRNLQKWYDDEISRTA